MARHGENIRKRKDGRWEARFICEYKEDGKAKYKSVYRKTYMEVKEARNQMMQKRFSGRSFNRMGGSYHMKFGDLLKDWLRLIRSDVKESTYSRYISMIEKHILPELGSMPLSVISSEDIERFTQKKLQCGNLKNSGGLSPKTVTGFLSVIRLALNYGAECGYDCCGSILIRNPRKNMPDIQILTSREQQKLESVLIEENSPVSIGILLSLYLGLRIGEICALRWEDFDLENGLLYVKRSMQRIPNLDAAKDNPLSAKTKIIIDDPKTSSSVRNIPIPAGLLPLFCQYKKEANIYVLTGSDSYLEPKGYYRKYKQIMNKCGLGRFNYHALRHTFATRCIENDFDVKSLSEILGHANVSTTLQRYVHPSVSLKRQHMDRLGTAAIYGQNSGQKDPKAPEPD